MLGLIFDGIFYSFALITRGKKSSKQLLSPPPPPILLLYSSTPMLQNDRVLFISCFTLILNSSLKVRRSKILQTFQVGVDLVGLTLRFLCCNVITDYIGQFCHALKYTAEIRLQVSILHR